MRLRIRKRTFCDHQDEDEESTINGDEGGRARLLVLLLPRVTVEAADEEDEEFEDVNPFDSLAVNFFFSPSQGLSSIL